MENTDITFEKRVKIVMGAFAVVVLFLIYHLAILMSVAPAFLESKIAHAPVKELITILNLKESMNYKYSE
jgi:hypothetical protein